MAVGTSAVELRGLGDEALAAALREELGGELRG